MLGETKNQFSLTRVASSACGRMKSKFLSVILILGLWAANASAADTNTQKQILIQTNQPGGCLPLLQPINFSSERASVVPGASIDPANIILGTIPGAFDYSSYEVSRVELGMKPFEVRGDSKRFHAEASQVSLDMMVEKPSGPKRARVTGTITLKPEFIGATSQSKDKTGFRTIGEILAHFPDSPPLDPKDACVTKVAINYGRSLHFPYMYEGYVVLYLKGLDRGLALNVAGMPTENEKKLDTDPTASPANQNTNTPASNQKFAR